MKSAKYGGYAIWISPAKDALSVLQVSDSLLLLGKRKALQAAIDRNPPPDASEHRPDAPRRYSPLLAHGAKLASKYDLWVAASQMPEPLANTFVPLEIEARSFDGGVSVADGLNLEATFHALSPHAATAAADDLQRQVPQFPAFARGLQVSSDIDAVILSLHLDGEELAASLRSAPPRRAAGEVAQQISQEQTSQEKASREKPPAKPAEAKPSVAAVAANPRVKSLEPAATIAAAVPPPAAPAVQPVPAQTPQTASAAVQPAAPRVIHIYGLDDGPREIVLPQSAR